MKLRCKAYVKLFMRNPKPRTITHENEAASGRMLTKRILQLGIVLRVQVVRHTIRAIRKGEHYVKQACQKVL